VLRNTAGASHRPRRDARRILLGGVLAILIGACDGSSDRDDSAFVGSVEESAALVFVNWDQSGEVTAYVCDGRAEPEPAASLSEWFSGTSLGDSAAIQNAGGFTLEFAREGDSVVGMVVQPNGRRLSFTTMPATPSDGLYRIAEEVDDQPVIGGFIFFGNQQRGAVKSGSCAVNCFPTPLGLTSGQVGAPQIVTTTALSGFCGTSCTFTATQCTATSCAKF
jgi:hypothetical protein